MLEERPNYCKILGLNPYAVNVTAQDISNAIVRAEARWKAEMQMPNCPKKKKFEYSEYLNMLPEIRSTMDSSILKNEEFDNARKILERKASKLRRYCIILRNGNIVVPANAAQNLADKIEWPGIDAKTIILASGIKAAPAPRPIDLSISNAYRMLSDLGAYSPYDLVNSLIDIPALDLRIDKLEPGCDPDAFRRAVDTINKRLTNIKIGQIPNLDAYIQAIRGLKSNYTDEKLPELVKYGNCMKVLAPAKEQMEEDSGSQFSRQYIDNIFLNYVNKSDADPELCTTLLEEFCVNRHFPANFSENDSSLMTCPRCKAMIFSGANSQFCTSCGAPISEVCPQCGLSQAAVNENCAGCGIPLAQALHSANDTADSIRKMIISGLTDKAATDLALLETKYPAYEDTASLKTKVRESNEKLHALIDRITSDYMSRSFYDLKRGAEEGIVDFPQLMSREDIHLRYNEACAQVRSADTLCIRAISEPENTMDLYIQASEHCPDHPDAAAFLSKYPPEGPADAEIISQPDSIDISYAIPEDRRGMTFCIYRNQGNYPEVDQSSRPIAETTEWVFSDTSAEPGVEYYYRIYTKRWGVLSRECAQCGPGLVIRQVTDVTIEPIDDGLKINYVIPYGADRVRIWRKEDGLTAGNGDEVEILHENNGTAVDRGLNGGTTYVYLLASEYDIDGTTKRSEGNYFKGMTDVLPTPINDLAVSWDKKHSCYKAKWTGPRNAELYYSTEKDTVPGERVSIKDLSTIMTRIEPIYNEDDEFRFELPEAPLMYICPAVTVGSTTVRGKECIVANLMPFRNITRSIQDFRCRLNMEWPEEATGAVARITGRNELGETATNEVEITRDAYNENGCFEFPLNGSAYTEVTLYAEYDLDGEARRSIGLSTEIYSGRNSRIYYTLDTESVKGDRKKTRVVIDFDCPDATAIPRCIMVLADGMIPLRAKDGEMIWESDEPTLLLSGKAECSFVIDKDAVSLDCMRLFFPDRSDYNKFRFVHPVRRK